MARKAFAAVFASVLSLLFWNSALAQFSQQGPKLVGTGAVGNAYEGASISLSADGNTAIVGGFNDSYSAGAAWVWTRSGGVWTQQGTKLVGAGAVGGGGAARGLFFSLRSSFVAVPAKRSSLDRRWK